MKKTNKNQVYEIESALRDIILDAERGKTDYQEALMTIKNKVNKTFVIDENFEINSFKDIYDLKGKVINVNDCISKINANIEFIQDGIAEDDDFYDFMLDLGLKASIEYDENFMAFSDGKTVMLVKYKDCPNRHDADLSDECFYDFNETFLLNTEVFEKKIKEKALNDEKIEKVIK